MWITEKIKNNWGKIIIIIFIIFVFVSKRYIDKIGEKNLKNLFKSEYKGIVKDKYNYRGLTVVCFGLLGYNDWNINSTEELYKNSTIGDTIIKIANSNLCIIKNKNKSIKVDCYFIE